MSIQYAPSANGIADARKSFRPGKRQACKVCGKYKSLAQAHHIVPLAAQGDLAKPNHEHVWLCPTHHAAIHVMLSQAMARRQKAGIVQIAMLAELEREEISALWEIFERFRVAI